MITHYCLVSRFRMHGAITPHPLKNSVLHHVLHQLQLITCIYVKHRVFGGG